MQALVYDKKYDNFIRSSCRHGGSAEAVLESETIAQELKKFKTHWPTKKLSAKLPQALWKTVSQKMPNWLTLRSF